MKSISTATITITSLLCATRTVVQSSSPNRNWSANPNGSINGRPSAPSFASRKSTKPKYYESQEEEEFNFANNSENDEDSIPRSLRGLGREFELFSGNVLDRMPINQQASSGPRGGSTENNSQALPVDNDNVSASTTYTKGRVGGSNRGRSRRSNRSSSRRRSAYAGSSSQSQQPRASHFQNPFSSLLTWVSDNQSSIPRIQVKVEPNTTLKLRKRFRPLFKTLVTLGADFNTQRGVWQFKSSWEDSIIGGRLMLAGRELQLSKTWLLSVGAVEDLVTRLRFRAAIDLGTGKAYARFGFRTERLSPINVVEGFTLLRQLPLDGPDGHVKLEVKANFAFPEPEIEYSTEKEGRSIIGMGDIEVNLDELNLLLDY